MQNFDTHAISLRATPFQEADQIVSFYTAEHGELRAVVKGVKRPTSKLAGACEPLTLNRVILARGKTLHTVCSYERIESFSTMRADLERMAAGTVCTEVIRLTAREEDPDSDSIYALLANTLHRLDQPEVPWIESSLLFHTLMLQLAGYLPMFDRCISCDHALDLDGTPYYPFFLSQGGFLCRDCYPMTKDPHRVNVSTTTLKLLMRPEDTSLYGNAVKAHRFLAYTWGHRLERPVKSFDFLFQLVDAMPFPTKATAG